MTEAAEQLLRAAVENAAPRLELMGASEPDGHLTELRHLRPAMKLALAQAAEEWSLSVEVGQEHEFQVPEWRSRAGVDIAYYVRQGLRRTGPAFVELKWGDGRRKVGECVWDLAKMGLAVALGKAPFAALVAGAPVSRWDSGIDKAPRSHRRRL